MKDKRRLSDEEKKDWVERARAYDKAISRLSKEYLEGRFEYLLCEMEYRELLLLVLERRLDKKRRRQVTLVPMPLRKSAEAMRLAFSDYPKENAG